MTVAVTVLMPAHNEAELLELSVREVVDGMRARGDTFELLVIENGSTDDTRAIAQRLAAAIPEVDARSLEVADYGRALRTGMLAANGTLVVQFDVDYYDLAFVADALGRLGDEPEPAIVVGSKRAPGARDTRPWTRRVITWAFTTLLRFGFGLHVSDTHGMKASVRARVEELVRRCRFDGDLFDTELVIRAERAGLVVAEIPVAVEERRPTRTSVAGRALRTVGGLARLRIVLWREGRDA